MNSRHPAGHPVFKVTETHHMLGSVHIRKVPGNTRIEAKSQISQSQKCPCQLQNCFLFFLKVFPSPFSSFSNKIPVPVPIYSSVSQTKLSAMSLAACSVVSDPLKFVSWIRQNP